MTQVIKKKEKDVRVLKRHYFIGLLYNGQSVEESAENDSIRMSNGHQILDRWNKEGYYGLAPKVRRRESLLDELNNGLIFLPNHSPKLNPIEYVWQSIKRIILVFLNHFK